MSLNLEGCSMSNKPEKNVINVDPVTVVAVISALLLVPLLISGFIFQ
ncbi:hypothetical protein MC7420_5933 [Coleofasciculus chthonoplastes PCC 7420]|uniref:Uncharacterized protein n=1 Tax=Coleofasciculus chthonoplastes PCC 7420 TaxID=118168 RepID=B4VVU3_9CYAN|nr:hypothetical protein MC7420_5933 [Coleofasciculus chthonoplastes PCC 7420]